ncbi:unnamed protein product, partial [Brassica oleracea]
LGPHLKILDCLDCDGNRDSVEPKPGRKLQCSAMRKPDGTYEANVVKKDKKNQELRRENVDARAIRHSEAVFDEPKRQPKQTGEQTVHA